VQQNQVNSILEETGFAYKRDGDYFYSEKNCWQRDFGYCRLYDELCPVFGMILDAEPVEFSYGGNRWLIKFWKGQYGITTGAEIGLYRSGSEDINSPRFRGTFYEAVPDDEMMELSFSLKKHGRVILRRSDRHFWLTGFLPGEFSEPRSLTLDAKIVFPCEDMAEVFAEALKGLGYTEREYSRAGAAVRIRYRKPHGRRNFWEKARDQAVQLVNYGNCRLYRAVTAPYTDTMDALEHLRGTAPHVFHLMWNALYPHAFFDTFAWLWEQLKPERTEPLKLPAPLRTPVQLPEPIQVLEPIRIPETAAPSRSSEQPPLILPIPVFVPRGERRPSPPPASTPASASAPASRPPEPSCLSELEGQRPAAHRGRQSQNRQNLGRQQQYGRR